MEGEWLLCASPCRIMSHHRLQQHTRCTVVRLHPKESALQPLSPRPPAPPTRCRPPLQSRPSTACPLAPLNCTLDQDRLLTQVCWHHQELHGIQINLEKRATKYSSPPASAAPHGGVPRRPGAQPLAAARRHGAGCGLRHRHPVAVRVQGGGAARGGGGRQRAHRQLRQVGWSQQYYLQTSVAQV